MLFLFFRVHNEDTCFGFSCSLLSVNIIISLPFSLFLCCLHLVFTLFLCSLSNCDEYATLSHNLN